MKLLFVLVTSSMLLIAGPPMLSDDPFVPKKGSFEFNFAATFEDGNEKILTAPIVDTNYALSDTLQLTLATGYIESHHKSDWDAYEISMKWNFYQNDFFAIALTPIYRDYPVHTVFNEGKSYKVGFPMAFRFTKGWSLVVTPNYVFLNTQDNHLELGSYLKYSYRQHDFFAEVFTESAKEYHALFTLVNFGYMWQFHEHVGFMLSLGREIRAEEKEATIAYSGLQLTF